VYLIYVDESGDTGFLPGSTRYFALSAIVLHELRWHQTLDSLIMFRRDLRSKYGLKLREEIHAADFIHRPGAIARIPKSLRLHIMRDALDFQAQLPDICLINVVVDKQGKAPDYDVFDNALGALVQRFDNTLSRHNLSGSHNAEDHGILVVDQTDEKKLRALTRRMRVYNPVPYKGGSGYRQMPIVTLVEDAVHRDSLHSYFIQMADVNACFLFQKQRPAGYVKKKGARNFFDRLDPVLCKVAAAGDPQGVVRL
jgi:hypothetical protein